MNRLEAIAEIVEQLPEEAVVFHANGRISRESHACRDRQRNLYLVGSMGLASSVAAGFAVQRPGIPVVVLDGDGNILMGLGNLALIGAHKPANLIHIVLDNGVYGTTGNQPTISSATSLKEMAQAAGYATTARLNTAPDITRLLPPLFNQQGPHFLQILISPEIPPPTPRLPFTAHQNKTRLLQSLPTS